MENVIIQREPIVKLYPFMNFFRGFERLPAVRQIFGKDTEKVLQKLKVEFFSFRRGYMGVNDEDGHLMISAYHLKNSDERTLYLDLIHELVHVKQFFDGKQLFDDSFEYGDRPTEVEAYRHTVKEARRLGLADDEIIEYL